MADEYDDHPDTYDDLVARPKPPGSPPWWESLPKNSMRRQRIESDPWYREQQKSGMTMEAYPDEGGEILPLGWDVREDRLPGGIKVRDPFDGEADWFFQHKDTPAMAGGDDNVVFNPFMKVTDQQRQALLKNEVSRAYMHRRGIKPFFEITPEQRAAFAGYGEDQDIRETIIGRILSGDPSAGAVTPEQRQAAEYVRDIMEYDIEE